MVPQVALALVELLDRLVVLVLLVHQVLLVLRGKMEILVALLLNMILAQQLQMEIREQVRLDLIMLLKGHLLNCLYKRLI